MVPPIRWSHDSHHTYTIRWFWLLHSPPVTPLFHAFDDLDKKFTKTLIFCDNIGCISSPTIQQ